ncbi:daunorubicin/doxorubicin resistance ABC transporter ATP-binding protein DrrA, partial [Amycolatopsis coloradensis]
MIAVQAKALVKTYGSTKALDGVDLSIPTGKVLG